MKKVYGTIISILFLILNIFFLMIIFSGINLFGGTNIFYFYLVALALFLFISGFFIFRLNLRSALISGVMACLLIIITLVLFSMEPDFKYYIQNISVLLNIVYMTGSLIGFFSIYFVLTLFLIIKKSKETAEIKKKILDLSVKLTRVEVKEISERVKVDNNAVKRVMKEMVQNEEVYGKFFSTSKALVFNQKANIVEIDNLMALYKDWEEREIGKKQAKPLIII